MRVPVKMVVGQGGTSVQAFSKDLPV